MKSNYTWINYNHDIIAIRSHIVICNFVWNFIFGTKFSSIYPAKKEKNVWCFDCHLLTRSVRQMVLICLMQNIDMCLCTNLIKSHVWYHTLLITFPNECLSCSKKILLNLVAKNEILHIFLYHWMTSYGYNIVDSCIISFNLNCIMQLKQFYNIATKVSSSKQCYYFWWSTLHWRHNEHDGVSNHQPHGCLLNRLFRRRSKKTPKLRVTALCVGNSPGPVNSLHKGPVTRKMFAFDDVIMTWLVSSWQHCRFW